MTICDKIQTLGETMETNLNARGVSCTFGTGTGESTVLEMVEMVNGTNFKGSSDVNLDIGANRPYLLTGETTDVIVRLEDGLCEPLKNKNVTIEQSLFIDNGTTASHNDKWSHLQYMTRTDTGTIINNTSGSALFEAIFINSSALPFTNEDLVVEFEIVENNYSTNKFRFDGQTLCDGESFRQYDFSFAQGETGKFKFVYDSTNNTIAKYKNGTYVDTYTHHFCGKMGFLFRLENGASIKIKDFIVYGTINGVTDEKGEFALYDVSVTDTTIFNATYGTETASTIVYSCLLTDYGVSNKYTNIWNNMNWFTRGSNGTSVYYQNNSSSTQQKYLSDYLTINGKNVAIDFELINSTYCRVQVERKDSGSQWLQCNYHNTNGKVHIEILSTGTYFYLDDTLFASNTNQLNQTSFRLFLLTASNSTTNFKYKDLRIYLL